MVRLAMMTMAAAGLLAAGACGGKGKSEDTGPDEVSEDDGMTEDPCAGGDDMCPPEKLEAIQNELNRKRATATRCLTDAVDAGEADKNAHGKVVVEFVIQKSGQAKDIEIVKSSIKSQVLESCIVDLVSKIGFPDIPKDLEWSYTFAFEAF